MNFDGNADLCIIKVIADSKADTLATKALAKQLGLPIADGKTDTDSWRLLVASEVRTLIRPDGARMNIDFTQGKAALRQAQPSKDQSLVRALGLHKLKQAQRQATHVIDATAGLGQDGWIIACQGCKTIWLEESPLVAVMLQHAIDHATRQPAIAGIANNVEVMNVRSQDYFAQLNNSAANKPARPDIIYLDPMFPAKKKQAKVKKGMQFLQALLPETDNTHLLQHALDAATNRVVVKRPAGAAVMAGTENWNGQLTTVETDATRFDIYHILEQASSLLVTKILKL
ncbi:MAG: class I SAM-dependent methyltransferase [Granulosicoccaceae bacterium]